MARLADRAKSSNNMKLAQYYEGRIEQSLEQADTSRRVLHTSHSQEMDIDHLQHETDDKSKSV